MPNLAVTINDCLFENNKADISGGAVFLGDLDAYDVTMSENTFKDNRCRMYGDNIYVEQT